MQKSMLEKVSSFLIIINGIICLIHSQTVLRILPTICGVIILSKGISKFVKGIKNKEYESLAHMDFERSIVAITIGLGILLKQSDAIFIIGMFWGLHGINNAVRSFNIAFYNIHKKRDYIGVLISGIIEFVLSILLIFDPFHSVGHHIIILGLELILEGALELYPKDVVHS